jgi:hypothetical protein
MAPDTIAHLKAGLAVLVASGLAAAGALHVGIHPLAVAVALAGIAASAAVEYAQRDSNARLQAAGHLPIHDVSPKDFVASAAPAAAAAVAIELATRAGLL